MSRILSVILFLIPFLTLAQPAPQQSASEIIQSIERAGVIGSVLYIAAHPDDENTRLLSYLSKERQVRTAYLSLTRGDGGQNLVGTEQGDALGILRTQELMEARKIDGAEQFFTRAVDFGFSKNPEETFQHWNKDSILSDVVRIIRLYKPDVIICRFPPTAQGGHGHHTASAILALEAFDMAADPKKFPEQLSYTEPWQSKRIFWNTYNFGNNNTISEDQLKIDVGGFNPLLGKSYGEIAAESRTMHKSQGFGSAKVRGSNVEYFKLMKGDTAQNDLFEGIELSWKRFPKAAGFDSQLKTILDAYDARNPSHSRQALVELYKGLIKFKPENPEQKLWIKRKSEEIAEIILQVSGLWLEALSSQEAVVPGDTLPVTLQVVQRSGDPITVQTVSMPFQNDSTIRQSLKHDQFFTIETKGIIPKATRWSGPYWLEYSHGDMYHTPDPLLNGKAETPPILVTDVNLLVDNIALTVQRPVLFKITDPVRGELYRQVEVLPPATVKFSDDLYVFADTSTKKLDAVLTAHGEAVTGVLKISAPAGWIINPSQFEFSNLRKNNILNVSFSLTPSSNALKGHLLAEVILEDGAISQSLDRISYEHITPQLFRKKAEVPLLRIPLSGLNRRIAYIPGAGDEIPASLVQIGMEVSILNNALLSTEDLSQFDAIVLGVRAYNINPELELHHEKLMQFVAAGGNLIMQYNTNNRIAPLTGKIGPYPFTISRQRVTDENAEIKFLDPSHPVLNFPNKIKSEDFQDWVQERGIYFAEEVDPHYQPILSMSDANEEPHSGSLIIAPYGKGNFVYTGLSFFRELPAGVPGAYKLFVNMLNLPSHDTNPK